MKAKATAVLCLLAISLAGCGQQKQQVAGSQWQVTDVYTTPEFPHEVPDAIAGAAVMSFGGSSMTGFTGCAPFQGKISFSAQEKQNVAPQDADRLTVKAVKFQPIDDATCEGRTRYIHGSLVDIIVGASFDVRHDGPGVITLLRSGESVDSPAIRLVVKQ
ncbi:hypothetical protein [Corynebacterium silvaticum]|uniref:Lipoprotein n=1 Tax=Corynebacterium silvaticum TaxID=2320431 RepID=A0A7Y4LJF0_9CORY|nr:hypothetical protein [Corynebacterium silvaticum]ARU46740.1 hypothetical protein CBE74_10090 [Corynebacterium silvaticum]MBH5300879.1 hypothetical protein [Corynebacterium silvaticum]NOM65077.1 hypothetical protein [Corynebacterium silvaticum]NON70043.1 hypothetical protein [Corynebacterium silvaticum]TFA91640.1 hypothetical protein EU802_10050 [Corynebacterium silvaticum]